MERTPQREEQVLRELKKLNKFLNLDDPLLSLDFVITTEGVDHTIYNVELLVKEPEGKAVVHVENYDIDLVIAHAVDKMLHELSTLKGRSISKRDRPDENKNPVRKDKEDFEK